MQAFLRSKHRLKTWEEARGGLALFFQGGFVAMKGPVGRGEDLNGCGHLASLYA